MIHLTDWKDVARRFYPPALTLTIVFIAFSFIVVPELQVTPYEKTVVILDAVEEIPEIREKIDIPKTVKPKILSELDESEGLDDEEGEEETLEETTFDAYEPPAPPPVQDETFMPDFVAYDDPPVAIRVPSPTYPEFAKKAGIQGTVILWVHITESGKVDDVKVMESVFPALDQEAVKALMKSRWKPAKQTGTPVAVWVNFPVKFELDQ